MEAIERPEITELLRRAGSGDTEAREQLMPLVYDELKRLASGHLKNHWNVTLSATGLVHEAFLRVAAQERLPFEDRAHFFGIASRTMRNVLVDMARQAGARKRGGGAVSVQLEQAEVEAASPYRRDDVLRLHEALNELAGIHPRPAQVVEMRYFGGMTAAEMASVLGVSEATIERDLRFGRAWLRRELSPDAR